MYINQLGVHQIKEFLSFSQSRIQTHDSRNALIHSANTWPLFLHSYWKCSQSAPIDYLSRHLPLFNSPYNISKTSKPIASLSQVKAEHLLYNSDPDLQTTRRVTDRHERQRLWSTCRKPYIKRHLDTERLERTDDFRTNCDRIAGLQPGGYFMTRQEAEILILAALRSG